MSSNFFVSHCMLIYYVNGIISLDKTFECCQFHTGKHFVAKLKLLLKLHQCEYKHLPIQPLYHRFRVITPFLEICALEIYAMFVCKLQKQQILC